MFDLVVLVDGSVDEPSGAGDLHVGFVDGPPAASGVPIRLRRVDEEGCEALDPSVDGDVIDLDATLDEEFLDVSVGESVPEGSAYCEHDDVRCEPVAGER